MIGFSRRHCLSQDLAQAEVRVPGPVLGSVLAWTAAASSVVGVENRSPTSNIPSWLTLLGERIRVTDAAESHSSERRTAASASRSQ